MQHSQRLISTTLTTTNPTTVLLNDNDPVGLKIYIKQLMLHNTSANAVDVELNLVPAVSGAAGTTAITNRFGLKTLAADADYSYTFGYPLLLEAFDSLVITASEADAINILGFGAIN